MNTDLFVDKVQFLSKIIAKYTNDLVSLNLYDLESFHKLCRAEERILNIELLCQELYVYIEENKSKTQHKNILGILSISLLYKSIDYLEHPLKKEQLDINHRVLEIVNFIMFLSGLLSRIRNTDTTAKIEKLSYTLYLMFKMVSNITNASKIKLLAYVSEYFSNLVRIDQKVISQHDFKIYAKAQKEQIIAYCRECNVQGAKLFSRYLDEYRIAVEDLYYREKVIIRIKKVQDSSKSIEDMEVDYLTYSDSSPILSVQSDYSEDPENLEDEVDEDKVTTHFDLNQNEDTRRLKGFVPDHMLHKHILRNYAPMVSNPYYLDPPLLKIVFQVLHDQFQENTDLIESAKAACFLMSIFTGISAVVFQNIDELLKSKKLKRSFNRNYYLWTLDADVNKNLKGQIAQKGNKYNEHTTWEFQIPATWIDRIREANIFNLTNVDFEESLSEWFQQYCLGPISVTSLALQLSFHLTRICQDDLQKNFLIGRKISHVPDLSYGGFSYKQLNKSYEQYVWLWFQNKDDVNALDRPQFIQTKDDSRVGSQRAWSFDHAKKFLKTLNSKVTRILKSEHDFVKKVNAFSVWIWICCLLATGARPAQGASSLKENYDFISKMMYINDKKSKSRPYGRFSPLIDFVLNELRHYSEFLKDFSLSKFAKNTEFSQSTEDRYYIIYLEKRSGFMNFKLEPLTQNKVASYLAENFPEFEELYPNWTRHFVRNHLNLSDATFKAWYAHDQIDEIGFSKYSSLQPYMYKVKILEQVNGLFNKLELTSVVSYDDK
ncbi:hypothetical protein ABEF79_05660 [Acinetobacter sp. ANC 7454]|uniref:hypothetical protein n=1 Tax=Acinetobacter thermotolerans TaxID=3151487 RepID=UPI00325ACBA5